jgi:hypothetical protein
MLGAFTVSSARLSSVASNATSQAYIQIISDRLNYLIAAWKARLKETSGPASIFCQRMINPLPAKARIKRPPEDCQQPVTQVGQGLHKEYLEIAQCLIGPGSGAEAARICSGSTRKRLF